MPALLAAFRFLTTLPIPGAHRLEDGDLGRATAWYPAVGLVLGGILAVLDGSTPLTAGWGLRRLWPDLVAAAVLLVAWVAMTGALHLDGFVDCCDALLAPVPPERRLEILRDVHTGAFGLVGLSLLLLTKITALAALPEGIRLPALLLVPTLGRWGMTAAVLLYPYARSGPGLGQRAKTGAGPRQLTIATVTALLVTALCWGLGLGWVALMLLILAALTLLLSARWIQSRIGGLTGDGYGAICELIEVAALLALAALAHRGVLP
jgi:adenosylcobinamide-GDP ribazoletransferase